MGRPAFAFSQRVRQRSSGWNPGQTFRKNTSNAAVLADQVSGQLLTFELSDDDYVFEYLGLGFLGQLRSLVGKLRLDF
jgi:hypothetical protein